MCPRGVFGAVCQRRSAGMEVVQSFDAHGRLDSLADATRQLLRTLEEHGIKRAELAIVIRGFGSAHHVLTFPRAADTVLDAIVSREVRRIEAQMTDPMVAWTRLAEDDTAGADQHNQVDVLAAALPGAAVVEISNAVSSAGHSLAHLTDLSVAMHRLADEFISKDGPAALAAQLPDGAFIGFSVDGALRFAVEPPVRQDDELPDAAALAEEAELGTVFVRQQFRGAQVTRVSIIASNESYPEMEAAFGARLEAPISRLPLPGLSPGGVAAFGGVLDTRSSHPVAVGGRSAEARAGQSAPALRLTGLAMIAAAAIVGIWTLNESLRARSAGQALIESQRRLRTETSTFAPALETTAKRRLVRDAIAALQETQGSSVALQRNVAAIASAVPTTVIADSIALEHRGSGWHGAVGGSTIAPTSGLAVQSLGDLYRDLSRVASVESLSLKQLTYSDTTGRSLVRFEIVFGLAMKPRD